VIQEAVCFHADSTKFGVVEDHAVEGNAGNCDLGILPGWRQQCDDLTQYFFDRLGTILEEAHGPVECGQLFDPFTEKMAKPSLFFVMDVVRRSRYGIGPVLKTSHECDSPHNRVIASTWLPSVNQVGNVEKVRKVAMKIRIVASAANRTGAIRFGRGKVNSRGKR